MIFGGLIEANFGLVSTGFRYEHRPLKGECSLYFIASITLFSSVSSLKNVKPTFFQDVVTYMHQNLSSINNHDFLDDLNKIFMEVTGVVTLDHRYGHLSQ